MVKQCSLTTRAADEDRRQDRPAHADAADQIQANGELPYEKSIRTAPAVALFVAPLMGCASIAGDGGDPGPETGLSYQDGVLLSPQYGVGDTYVSPGDHTLRLVNGIGGVG